MQPLHPIFTDALFQQARSEAAKELELLAAFLEEPKRPIYNNGVGYTRWAHSIGIPKKATKWFAPLWVNAAPKNLTHVVYGKDAAPVKELGDRSISAYIRYLLFVKQMSPDGIRHKLISQLGYSAKSARPLVRRISRDIEEARRIFTDRNEAAQFDDFAL